MRLGAGGGGIKAVSALRLASAWDCCGEDMVGQMFLLSAFNVCGDREVKEVVIEVVEGWRMNRIDQREGGISYLLLYLIMSWRSFVCHMSFLKP